MTKKTKLSIPTNITLAFIYILLGVLLCIFKQSVVAWAMLIVGILFVAQGILNVLNKQSTAGIIGIVVGALLIIFRFTAQHIMMIIFGILLAASGLSQLVNGGYKKVFPLLTCVLSIVGGIIIICNSSAAVDFVFIISGVIFIVDGVLALLGKAKA